MNGVGGVGGSGPVQFGNVQGGGDIRKEAAEWAKKDGGINDKEMELEGKYEDLKYAPEKDRIRIREDIKTLENEMRKLKDQFFNEHKDAIKGDAKLNDLFDDLNRNDPKDWGPTLDEIGGLGTRSR